MERRAAGNLARLARFEASRQTQGTHNSYTTLCKLLCAAVALIFLQAHRTSQTIPDPCLDIAKHRTSLHPPRPLVRKAPVARSLAELALSRGGARLGVQHALRAEPCKKDKGMTAPQELMLLLRHTRSSHASVGPVRFSTAVQFGTQSAGYATSHSVDTLPTKPSAQTLRQHRTSFRERRSFARHLHRQLLVLSRATVPSGGCMLNLSRHGRDRGSQDISFDRFHPFNCKCKRPSRSPGLPRTRAAPGPGLHTWDRRSGPCEGFYLRRRANSMQTPCADVLSHLAAQYWT